MCGIAGIINKNSQHPVQADALIAMRDTMIHRGPDDEGIFISGSVGLAHRRLSIVGLSTGHQPLADQDQSLWIIFNGEIYNYPQLRIDQEKKGYSFQTKTDTEVIISLYAEYGRECVHHLNGMFAFAIWDKRREELFIARDRLGIKPFYYAETPDSIIFGSEIKSLLKFPGFNTKCNQEMIYEYFLFRAVAGENTLFLGVRSLLPGHHMTVNSRGKVTIEKYWDHRVLPVNEIISQSQARDYLHKLLVDSVRIRLMSEVPLGTLCSGGVDSSLVTAIAAKAIGKSVNTFSVGFHEAEFDETYYARLVSARYGTSHYELKLSNEEFAELLPEMILLNDEPLNFSNSVHMYAISKLAKEYVTVVLTGEGADELFFGYPRYQIPRLAQKLRSISLIAGPALMAASKLHRDHRLDKLLYYLKTDIQDVMKHNSASNHLEMVHTVLSGSVAHCLDYRTDLLHELEGMDHVLSKTSLLDQKTYLVSILNRQDKMSMGASVESRVPFLDYRIAEFANSLPARTRMRGFNTKMLVKQVAESYLPKEVIYRKKSGFGVPLANWFRADNGLGGLVRQVIHETEDSEYLNCRRIRQLYQEHHAGLADHSEILWTVVNFFLWRKNVAA